MSLLIRLGMLVAVLSPCSFIAAQATADQIAPVTSALRAGRYDDALKLLQREIEQSPQSPQLWTLRGMANSGKGEKKQALVAFRHALSISPDYLPALEGAAQIEYESGGKDAAALLEHVHRLRPQDPTSQAMLAVLAYRRETAPLRFRTLSRAARWSIPNPEHCRSTVSAW